MSASSGDTKPTTNYKQDEQDETLNIVAYMFAGLAMMLNIRLSYSAAPYALLRFKLPENLFSVFVRTTSSALELWCLPSMLLGNIMEQVYNNTQDNIGVHVIGLGNKANQLANLAQELSGKASTLADVSGLNSQATALKDAAKKTSSPDQTSLHKKATDLATNPDYAKAKEVIDAFGKVMSTYETLSGQQTYKDKRKSALEKIAAGQSKTLSGDEEKVKDVEDAYNELQKIYSNAIYSYKWHLLTMPSMFTNWLNFLTFVILFIVYISGGEQGSVTGYYWVMAISGFVFGINMVLVYAVDYRYLPYYIAGENSFPIVTSAILYFATSIFGNRRKYNSDYLVVLIDISISIIIAFVASVLWTEAFKDYRTPMASRDSPNKEVASPVLLVLVGMGLVYSIYPGIAPGMIVPFYLIDKIEMVLLILTTFPPLIFAFTTKYAPNWSPKTNFVWHGFGNNKTGFGGWKRYASDHKEDSGKPGQCADNEPEDVHGWIWHFFDILAPIQIILAVIFIYSIHYKDSSISRSIVNQPKMSTFLTIIFYMCHEIMLATGFPGLVCNNGVTWVLLPTQWVGALLMVFLAFYSIGYITEYKRHDPSEWPTDGMTWWNSVCYWLKMASKITNKNFKQLFTTETSRDPNVSKNNIINTIIYYTLLN